MLTARDASNVVSLFCQESRIKFLADNICVDNGIILYGSGELGKLALSYCQKCNIRTRVFLDQSCILGEVSELSGVYTFNPSHQFSSEYYDIPVVVCVATYPFESIRDSLLSMGWKSIFPFYQLTKDANSFYPITNGWLVGQLSQTEKSRIEYVFEHLEDDCSREHYKSFLCWHSGYHEQHDPKFPINPTDRYYVGPIKDFLYSKSHTIIDAGAHRGQLLDIVLAQRILINEYHAFEPDPESYEIITNKLMSTSFPSAAYQKCISSEISPDAKFFAGLNYCSKLSSFGSLSVETVSIDSLDLNPTIIKYHTEGAEFDGLRGSRNTIDKCQPLIMASLYHSRDGLCDILYYFMATHRNYRYYLRLHSYQGTGLFLYALPIEP